MINREPAISILKFSPAETEPSAKNKLTLAAMIIPCFLLKHTSLFQPPLLKQEIQKIENVHLVGGQISK